MWAICSHKSWYKSQPDSEVIPSSSSVPSRIVNPLFHLLLKIGDQRPSDALLLIIRMDYQWMQLPDVAIVLGQAANPTQHRIVIITQCEPHEAFIQDHV